MPGFVKGALLVVALLCALCGAASAVGHACVAGMCGEEAMFDALSPDGRHRVVGSIEDCGATTPYVLHVSIVPWRDAIPREANVAVADSDHKSLYVGDAKAFWTAPDAVTIRYPSGARFFLKKPEVDGVRIVYEPTNARDGE